jgi:hypothetical protein
VNATGLLALAGAVVGAVIGVVLHALVWRQSGPVGWYAFSEPRHYVDPAEPTMLGTLSEQSDYLRNYFDE